MFNTSVLPTCYINTYIVPLIIKSNDISQNSQKKLDINAKITCSHTF